MLQTSETGGGSKWIGVTGAKWKISSKYHQKNVRNNKHLLCGKKKLKN